MTSIKKFSVRATKKGKKRGRPSNAERYVSMVMSHIYNSSSFKKELCQCVEDTLLYGAGVFDCNKAKMIRAREDR